MCQTWKHSAPPFILNAKWFAMLPQCTLRQYIDIIKKLTMINIIKACVQTWKSITWYYNPCWHWFEMKYIKKWTAHDQFNKLIQQIVLILTHVQQVCHTNLFSILCDFPLFLIPPFCHLSYNVVKNKHEIPIFLC